MENEIGCHDSFGVHGWATSIYPGCEREFQLMDGLEKMTRRKFPFVEFSRWAATEPWPIIRSLEFCVHCQTRIGMYPWEKWGSLGGVLWRRGIVDVQRR
jgi:hypothetical protein